MFHSWKSCLFRVAKDSKRQLFLCAPFSAPSVQRPALARNIAILNAFIFGRYCGVSVLFLLLLYFFDSFFFFSLIFFCFSLLPLFAESYCFSLFCLLCFTPPSHCLGLRFLYSALLFFLRSTWNNTFLSLVKTFHVEHFCSIHSALPCSTWNNLSRLPLFFVCSTWNIPIKDA